MAAVIACGPDAVLSHRSAGRLWGLLPPAAETVDVTRPRGTHTRRPGITGHECTLLPDEIARVDGIPVTSLSRTLFDLASVLSRRQLERALNEAEVRQLTDRLSLPDLLARYPRRRGTATLRALLAAKNPGGITRNDFEEGFVAFLDAYDLPRPRFNATMPVRGRLLEADCMWRKERLIVELDSRAVHGTERAFESDRRRDRFLLVDGWRSTRVTWRQLRDEAPALAADLRGLLGASAPAPQR